MALWKFLSSVKLTIVLLILLAIVSILGTLIPQQQGAVEFAKGLAPGMFRFLSTLQLFDMYNAPLVQTSHCLSFPQPDRLFHKPFSVHMEAV